MTMHSANQSNFPQKSLKQTGSSDQPEAGRRDADTEATRSSSPTGSRMSNQPEATPEAA